MAERILVIDDELFARRLLEMILEKHGYEVLLAANGPEGLRLLQQQPVDLVTCDMMMPGMNGIEFLKRVLDDPALRHIPVLLVTAAGTQEDLDQALAFGAAGTLVKPFSERQLAQLVRKALASRKTA